LKKKKKKEKTMPAHAFIKFNSIQTKLMQKKGVGDVGNES